MIRRCLYDMGVRLLGVAACFHLVTLASDFGLTAEPEVCLQLPADITTMPADCNGIDWCNCLSSALSHNQGGEAATVLQKHVYAYNESTPGEVTIDMDGGTLRLDLLEVDDVIGKFIIDMPSGAAENFVLDFSLIVTEIDLEREAAAFEIRLVDTNPTSIEILGYDPLDAAHSNGVLHVGEVEAFGDGGGFFLRYGLLQDLNGNLRSIEDGDLSSPGFSVIVETRFFAPDDFESTKEVYTLPAQGGTLTLESEIRQMLDPLTGKTFVEEFEVEPGVLPGTPFRRGDCDDNGVLDVTDAVNTLAFQFLGTFDPGCLDACDFDDNGTIDVTDPIGNLTHQFLGGPPPVAPGKNSCGVDPTPEVDVELTCEEYASC